VKLDVTGDVTVVVTGAAGEEVAGDV
jgi:hypothetical protein